MKHFAIPLLALAAGPAFAAGDKPFFSLANTDFVVLISFLLFIGVLVYLKVPGLLGGLLDKRAAGIQAEIDEARALREHVERLPRHRAEDPVKVVRREARHLRDLP